MTPSDAAAFNRREAFTVFAVGTAAAALAGPAQAHPAPLPATGPATLLYPHDSPTRSSCDLSGLWRFRLDPDDVGEGARWSDGLTNSRAIPVPCSWNDLFDGAHNYTGTAWYERAVTVDPAWRGRRIHLRFGSAVYRAKVWFNGHLLGEHVGGHLPFAFTLDDAVRFDTANRLVVMVENKLRLDRVPAIPDPATSRVWASDVPQTSYDFFPYSGLHRPVVLFATPATHVHDVGIVTTLSGGVGLVTVDVTASDRWTGPAAVTLTGDAAPLTVAVAVRNGVGRATIRVPRPRLWGPDDPYLFTLTIRLGDDAGPALDEYALKVGIRTIAVAGEQLLLNGKPIALRGFGKHEDFFLHGRGLDLAVLVRDFELLKWIGANSFRTSHYPYSEEAMMLADEYGFLVIDETPAVSLTFSDRPEIIAARATQLCVDLSSLVARDRNHPCVILWSVANEPLTKPFHTLDEAPANAVETGRAFFAAAFAHLRSLDATRPVALVSLHNGPADWVGQGDIICTNSYNGWYAVSADIPAAEATLEREFGALQARHPGKPIFFTEFGADAVAGLHDQPAAMWSEDYQSELLAMYLRVLARHAVVVGVHPWAFADFHTAQSVLRVDATNYKGVFTRDRRPKLAARMLREAWAGVPLTGAPAPTRGGAA